MLGFKGENYARNGEFSRWTQQMIQSGNTNKQFGENFKLLKS